MAPKQGVKRSINKRPAARSGRFRSRPAPALPDASALPGDPGCRANGEGENGVQSAEAGDEEDVDFEASDNSFQAETHALKPKRTVRRSAANEPWEHPARKWLREQKEAKQAEKAVRRHAEAIDGGTIQLFLPL